MGTTIFDMAILTEDFVIVFIELTFLLYCVAAPYTNTSGIHANQIWRMP